MKFIGIVYLILVLFGCDYADRKNELFNNAINPQTEHKAIVYYTTGMVSVFSYNVSIVPYDSELSNNDLANVFSYSGHDTIQYDKDTLVEIVWQDPGTLVIYHPKKGTFWKKEKKLTFNGADYMIEYKIK